MRRLVNTAVAVIGSASILLLGIGFVNFQNRHKAEYTRAEAHSQWAASLQYEDDHQEQTTVWPSTAQKITEIVEETQISIEETEISTEIPTTTIGYSEEEYELLAHLIMGEAGCDMNQDETLYLVGAVVMNRVKSDRYPNSIREVIYQPGQYACTWDGNIDKEPTERCYYIAENILMNGTKKVPEDVVYQAEFPQGSDIYKIVDGMYFCHEERRD